MGATITDSEVLQSLKLAADLIRGGWCQDSAIEIWDSHECFCLAYAVETAARRVMGDRIFIEANYLRVISPIGEYIKKSEFVPDCESSRKYDSFLAIEWNDDHERTQSEVVELLESVVAELERGSK